jgi:transcriptional regulator with XRE-family HTH domain
MPKKSNRARESFADRVTALRQQNALTASDLAKLANVTPAAVWNWEKNGITPRPATVTTLANKLGVTPEFLLTGDTATPMSSESQPAVIDAGASIGVFNLKDASLEELISAIEAKGFSVIVRSRSTP